MWITYDGYNCFLEHANFKDDLIEYRCCLCCNKSYQQMFDAKLKERFFIYIYIYTNFCNKFILLLQKDVYLYKYMNDWEKVDKTSLPKKNNFKIT